MKKGNEYHDGDFYVCSVEHGKIINWGDGIDNFNEQELYEFLGGEVPRSEINKIMRRNEIDAIESELDANDRRQDAEVEQYLIATGQKQYK